MAPKFGTSGLRGLVVELTPDLIADHIRAFLRACPSGTGLWVARDLRPSSPELAAVVLQAARAEGIATVDAGDIPTPALALAAMGAGAAAVMITGSHIPADRNGLKFYLPDGEIAKTDEAAILAALGTPSKALSGPQTRQDSTAGPLWVQRYLTAFGPDALAGQRIGVWSHSAVSRDLLLESLQSLGATVLDLGRSDIFIPVDTEAVDPAAHAQMRGWIVEHALDAVISTDGDGDRPLLCGPDGAIIPGDILGQITAAALGAEVVVTPVSSNTGVEASGRFAQVIRTKIGSPFVVAGMGTVKGAKVVGYEANGGFLLGFTAQGPAGPLPPLATRDSLLPLIAPLWKAKAAGGLAALVAGEPARFTSADRLENIASERSLALIAGFNQVPAKLQAFLADLDEEMAGVDRTDGLRVTLTSGRVLHMRPSGNAPEFRLYVEAASQAEAAALQARGFAALTALLA